jgi:hypothetical protein
MKEIEMAEDLDLYVRLVIGPPAPSSAPHQPHLHRFSPRQQRQHRRRCGKHAQDLRVIYDKYAGQLGELGIELP